VATVIVAVPDITIIGQPAATLRVNEGSITGTLTTTAVVTPAMPLNFQWYSNISNTNTGGTAIEGATSASFVIPTGLREGTYYFYCVVSTPGAIPRVSNVSTVIVNPPLHPVVINGWRYNISRELPVLGGPHPANPAWTLNHLINATTYRWYIDPWGANNNVSDWANVDWNRTAANLTVENGRYIVFEFELPPPDGFELRVGYGPAGNTNQPANWMTQIADGTQTAFAFDTLGVPGRVNSNFRLWLMKPNNLLLRQAYFTAEDARVPDEDINFDWTIFEEDWRETINIRFFEDGTLINIPLDDIEFIVDGAPVANIRSYAINLAGWQTETSSLFINKNLPWQDMTVRVTRNGQTRERSFVNHFFILPEFTWTIFAEDWRDTINIRLFEGGVPVNIPLSEIEVRVDGRLIPADQIRNYTVNLAGWQTETSSLFINKNTLPRWQNITVRIRTQEASFANNRFYDTV
jgi:hypothetical protein